MYLSIKSWDRVSGGVGVFGCVCKVIIVSNPIVVKVDLSCIEVRLGF